MGVFVVYEKQTNNYKIFKNWHDLVTYLLQNYVDINIADISSEIQVVGRYGDDKIKVVKIHGSPTVVFARYENDRDYLFVDYITCKCKELAFNEKYEKFQKQNDGALFVKDTYGHWVRLVK